jgi:hypothetical protein
MDKKKHSLNYTRHAKDTNLSECILPTPNNDPLSTNSFSGHTILRNTQDTTQPPELSATTNI